MKECPKCHQILDPSAFNKDRTKKDGLGSYCRQCSREHNIQYRKQRMNDNLCYDCGIPLPKHNRQKRFCKVCYKRRLKNNVKYQQQRNEKGICLQCWKQPIEYSRSQLHCSRCLDKRNKSARLARKMQKK